jgi:hypothetical protein
VDKQKKQLNTSGEQQVHAQVPQQVYITLPKGFTAKQSTLMKLIVIAIIVLVLAIAA